MLWWAHLLKTFFSLIICYPSDLLDVVNCYPRVSFKNEAGVDMVDVMNKYFLMYGDQKNFSRTKEDILTERKWRQWADSDLVHKLR
jgi:hypothetical protein